MNFAIEVPAEANPLTTQTLFHVLQSASSNDQQQVKTGTQQLQNWETSPGFFSLLQSLYVDYSLPVELRYLAIIQLKNGIDKYWRMTARNAISKEEKNLIRSQSIESGVNEPDHRLALQLSVVIAKIIRHEYPQDWPDPITSILEKLRQTSQQLSNPMHLSRTLLVLLYVIKELSTSRLQRSRKTLQASTPEIVKALALVYTERAEIWVSFLQNRGDDEGGALESLEQSLLALRALRRLIVAGYDFPNRYQEITDVWNHLASQFGYLLATIQNASSDLHAQPLSLIEKHVIQIAKLHVNLARDHPAGFALLPNSASLAGAYWGLIRQFSETYGSQSPFQPAEIGTDGDAGETASALETISLKGLLLIRACMKMVFNPAQTFRYQQPEDKEENNRSKELIKRDLLSEPFAREVMEILVTRFFVFTPRDLREWEEEPDEWEKSQEATGEDWELSIRTCSEKLFLDLMVNHKGLVPPLIAVFQDVATLQNKNLLLKDSIYTAIGIAAPVLDRYPEFDFGHFLEDVLVQEVQISQPGFNILRRRAAIMLGQWLPIKEKLNRPLVYQIFQHLLDKKDPLNDEVVRVTAGRQLKNVIDPFEFEAQGFGPYLSNIIVSIMGLIHDVGLPETKMALLNTISLIVAKMERQAESRRYHSLIIPLIGSSVEPSSETRTYLLEDALDLWAAVLEQTPSEDVPADIIALVRFLTPLYEVASENLKKALEITELYIYIIPGEMLSNAAVILNPLAFLLSAVKREATGMVTSLAELLIRSAISLAGVSGLGELTQVMLSSNMLPTLLSGLHDAYIAHQTTGPNRKVSQIDGIVETDYLNVMARLAIASPTMFLAIIDTVTFDRHPEGQQTLDAKLAWLLTEWLSHMDNIGHPAHKKLNCLALTSLLETGEPWILSRLQSLMSVWTDVVNELVEDYSLQEGIEDKRDSLVYQKPEASEFETPADVRRRLLGFEDPVHRIDIRVFVREKLTASIETCGGMDTFQREWVQNVDQDVVKSFGDLGII
ncbi:importin-11, partial [Lecanoromycetidae sp. Uapishka_2]